MVAQLNAFADTISIVASQQNADEYDSCYTDNAGDDFDDDTVSVERTVLVPAAASKHNFSAMYEQKDCQK